METVCYPDSGGTTVGESRTAYLPETVKANDLNLFSSIVLSNENQYQKYDDNRQQNTNRWLKK